MDQFVDLLFLVWSIHPGDFQQVTMWWLIWWMPVTITSHHGAHLNYVMIDLMILSWWGWAEMLDGSNGLKKGKQRNVDSRDCWFFLEEKTKVSAFQDSKISHVQSVWVWDVALWHLTENLMSLASSFPLSLNTLRGWNSFLKMMTLTYDEMLQAKILN